LALAPSWYRAGNADIDFLEVWLQVRRPQIHCSNNRVQGLASGDKPPLPCHIADRCRGLPLYNHLHVVHRAVPTSVRTQTILVFRRMPTCVPPLYRQIDPACECKPVVDDNNFLMM
jgi:hypothetical protein